MPRLRALTNPMSELSGLNLRKTACEALGMKIWIADGKHGYALSGGCIVYSAGGLYFDTGKKYESKFESSKGKIPIVEPLPAIESDPAVSEPMLDEFCKARGLYWRVSRNGLPIERKFFCSIEDGSCHVIALADGSTPSEARARAIVEASKSISMTKENR